MAETSILALFPGALGDYLCVRPALLRLRQRGDLTVATHAAYAPLLAADGLRALSLDRREVADLFATTPLSRAARELLGGRDEIHSWTGYGDANFAARLTHLARRRASVYPFRDLRRGEHASAYYARCAGVRPLRRPWPVPAPALSWAAGACPAGRPLLALHAGSGGRRKNWLGMEAVAQRWREQCGEVVQLAGPAEAAQADFPAATVVRDQPLDRVAAVLQRATVYLGNDSGISHLAAAVGARGLALFASTSTRAWAPRGGGMRFLRTRRACRACGDAFCAHRLPVDDVWRQLLAAAALS